VQGQVGPQGDEPHYLMVADSLLRDQDLSLESDYQEGRYRAFFDGPLEPHYRVRGKGGEIYSLHALGLSLLVLPAYAIGGYPAASFFMAGLAALLALEIRALLRSLPGAGPAAEGVAWLVALCPPLVPYAGLVFTEVPAALLVAIALRRSRPGREMTAREGVLVGAALAFLPWLNVRYAPLSVLLFAYAVFPRAPKRVWLALGAPGAFSALALLAYHQALYGFFDPRLVYGRRPEFALGALVDGLPGLLLDQEFGLLVYAPIFALALLGLVRLWAWDRACAAVTGVGVAVVLFTAGTWHMWRGGFNPPARFLVPIVPLLALAVLAAVKERMTASVALLAGVSLFTAGVGLAEPRLVHRDRDGTAPLWRAASGAEEWTRLLPGYVLADPDRTRLALVWSAALAVAVASRARPRTTSVAAMTAGLLLATGAASVLSNARTGGRDYVRLVGRPAVAVPAFRFVPSAVGRWRPSELDWGPVYEPHRFPDGAEFASRLDLPEGGFRITVLGDDLSPQGPVPWLEVRSEGAQPRRTRWPLARVDEGLSGGFALLPGENAASLRLHGGSPFGVKEFRLEPQPLGPGPV
jgi:hypothetical protein